jgi:glucan phosphoethanolaminetransferase (alkaline phosphatase superfamily)
MSIMSRLILAVALFLAMCQADRPEPNPHHHNNHEESLLFAVNPITIFFIFIFIFIFIFYLLCYAYSYSVFCVVTFTSMIRSAAFSASMIVAALRHQGFSRNIHTTTYANHEPADSRRSPVPCNVPG